jgi:hypothetical protein
VANPTYATRSYTVPAGGSVQVARASDFLSCLEASHPFKVSFDNQPRTDFEAGLTYDTETGFQLVEVINTEAEELTVKLGFGRGNITDARLVLPGAVDVSGSTVSIKNNLKFMAQPVAIIPPQDCFLVLGYNPVRQEIGIKNISEARLWIMNTMSLSEKGHALDPGETIVLNATSAIYAYNSSATAGSLSVWFIGAE